MSRKKSRLAALALVALAACAAALPSSGGAAPKSRRLTPQLFVDLSSGIALIRAFNCHGEAIDEGSGFLVGSSVVMTAGHVVRDACKNRVKVLLGGKWYAVTRRDSWYKLGQKKDARAVDVSTLQLTEPSDGHIFVVGPTSPLKGANLSALGHPLGNDISLNQGHVVLKLKHDHVPLLAVRMLGAEGGSGSPLVDDSGNVVGILQIGLGSTDILGQRTAGLVLGIDLPSWWAGQTEASLCSTYKTAGIPNCDNGTLPPPTTTLPPPPPPSGPAGSRTNPWPIGSAAAAGDWTVRVNGPANFDAWSVVAHADPTNPKPPAGYVDVETNITGTYNGSASGSLTKLEDILGMEGGSNFPYGTYTDSCGTAPHPNANDFGLLAPTQSATFNVCAILPMGDLAALELRLDEVWFALR